MRRDGWRAAACAVGAGAILASSCSLGPLPCETPPRVDVPAGRFVFSREPQRVGDVPAHPHDGARDLTLDVDHDTRMVVIRYTRPDGARVEERWAMGERRHATEL